MSDTSLYAGLYKYACALAELVDNVLVEIKTKPKSYVSSERKRLGEMLIEVSMNQRPDLSSRLLALMLGDIPRTRPMGWQRVGQALLSEKVDERVVGELESLARALENEQLRAASRIRG